jgi:hypothetical protein
MGQCSAKKANREGCTLAAAGQQRPPLTPRLAKTNERRRPVSKGGRGKSSSAVRELRRLLG